MSAAAAEVLTPAWTDGLTFRVVEVDGPRIERLEVEFRAPLSEEEASPEAASGGE